MPLCHPLLELLQRGGGDVCGELQPRLSSVLWRGDPIRQQEELVASRNHGVLRVLGCGTRGHVVERKSSREKFNIGANTAHVSDILNFRIFSSVEMTKTDLLTE